MKSIRIATVLVAFVTAACNAGTVSPSVVASSPLLVTASPANPTASRPSLLEGIWTTAEITCDQQLATMHAAGFTDAQITARNWACSQPVRFRLRFLGDQFAQFDKQGNKAWEQGSGRSFKLIDDHTVFLTDGGQTMSFTLVGNLLTFVSIDGSTDDLDGQVHGPAIFLTAPFTRQD
jgi:hypothetical protein